MAATPESCGARDSVEALELEADTETEAEAEPEPEPEPEAEAATVTATATAAQAAQQAADMTSNGESELDSVPAVLDSMLDAAAVANNNDADDQQKQKYVASSKWIKFKLWPRELSVQRARAEPGQSWGVTVPRPRLG